MHFCSECGNMYYIKINEDDPNTIVYYCKNCGHENKDVAHESVIVSKTNVYKNNTNYHQFVNKYTKLDPTLPRVKNMKCPNPECITASDKSVEQNVIFIRYDDKNLKYIYICSHCDHIWNMTNS